MYQKLANIFEKNYLCAKYLGEFLLVQLDLGVTKKLKQWTFLLQATDVFRMARNSMFTYGTNMLIDKWNYSDSQAVKLTISCRFNTANSKYKGTGAGNAEKNRTVISISF